MRIAIVWLVAINAVSFVVYGLDKQRAKRSRWRISESALLALALAGGSIGAWMGMLVWRHKTKHKKFRYGIPLIIIVQCIAVLLIEGGLS